MENIVLSGLLLNLSLLDYPKNESIREIGADWLVVQENKLGGLTAKI